MPQMLRASWRCVPTVSTDNLSQDDSIAVLCDHSGLVRRWLRDGIGARPDRKTSVSFLRILDESSHTKGLNFLARVAESDDPVDWDLCFSVAGRPKVLKVAGCSGPSGSLVIAGRASAAVNEACIEIANAFPDLRGMCEKISAVYGGKSDVIDDAVVYEQLMRMYNDFARLQRQYASQNANLLRLANEKEHILSMAAHDLRGPLNAMSLLSSSLAEQAADRLTVAEAGILQKIVDTAVDMSRSLNELLDAARYQPEGPTLDAVAGNLEDLVRERVKLLDALAITKNLNISLEVHDDIPQLPFDEVRLQHVIDNVLGNAVKYSPPNSMIEVFMGRTAEAVYLDVCDRGCGLMESEVNRIFRPFETGSAKPTGGEESKGLGLAICHSIVTAHGGTIAAANREGGGAVFRILLPVPGDPITR